MITPLLMLSNRETYLCSLSMSFIPDSFCWVISVRTTINPSSLLLNINAAIRQLYQFVSVPFDCDISNPAVWLVFLPSHSFLWRNPGSREKKNQSSADQECHKIFFL